MSRLTDFIRKLIKYDPANRYYNFLVAPELKLIIRWNPKCGCTTLKKLLLLKLGHKTDENVHLFIEKDGYKNGEDHGIYTLANYCKKNDNNLDEYKRIIIVRDVYERLISGLIERSQRDPFQKAGYLDLTISEFIKKLNKCKDDHFFPQSYKLPNGFKFDYIINLKNINFLKKLIHLETPVEKVGDHLSQYADNGEDYKFKPMHTFLNQPNYVYNKNIYSYFSEDDLEIIKKYYRRDFELLDSVNVANEFGQKIA